MVFAFSLPMLVPTIGQADSTGESPRFIATYFYTKVRCPSCITIESWTESTIRSAFKDQLDSGLLQWRTINIDGKGNFHYVKDYNLYTKSVIVSEMDGGKEIRWQNLAKVWELLRNEGKFRKYVKTEIRRFMEQR
jgi:hypothetical protein